MKSLLLVGSLVFFSTFVSPKANAQMMSSMDTAVSALKSRLPIPFTGHDALNYSGHTASGAACKGYFSGLGDAITIQVQSDAGDGKMNIMQIELNPAQVAGSSTDYNVVQKVQNYTSGVFIRMMRHEAGPYTQLGALSDTREKQELYVGLDSNGSLASVSITLARGVFGVSRTGDTCFVDHR